MQATITYIKSLYKLPQSVECFVDNFANNGRPAIVNRNAAYNTTSTTIAITIKDLDNTPYSRDGWLFIQGFGNPG